MACVTRTLRDEALVEMSRLADQLGWKISAKRSDVELRTPHGDQLWRIDALWKPGATVSVAVRSEGWLLSVPSVRVETVDGTLKVVEGCRRFSTPVCEEGSHAGRPCMGHLTLGIPDPFPFEKFVAAVAAGSLECVYLDNVIDPPGSPEQRWGGYLWLRSDDAERLEEWQGYRTLETPPLMAQGEVKPLVVQPSHAL